MEISADSKGPHRKGRSWLVQILGALILLLVFSASQCEQETRFLEAKQEICGDGIDNDENGKTDCEDSFCATSCQLQITVNPPFATAADSQLVTGNQKNATKIIVEILPNYESNGQATIQGSEWSFLARKLKAGVNTLTITASDVSGNTQKLTTTITVANSSASITAPSP